MSALRGAVACLAGLAAVLLLWPHPARGHETRPAYLELRETAPGRFSVLWRTPALSGQRLLSPAARAACFPLTAGFGCEVRMTIDALAAGLDVSENGLPDLCLQALTAFPHLRRLSCLNLGYNALTDEGLRHLGDWATLPQLASLSLAGNPISDEGIRTLAASPFVGRLHTLHLDCTDVTANGMRALLASPQVAGLTELRGTPVLPDAAKRS